MNSTQDFTLDVHVLAQKKWDIHGPKMNSSIPEKWEGHKLSTRPSFKELFYVLLCAMIFGCVRWGWKKNTWGIWGVNHLIPTHMINSYQLKLEVFHLQTHVSSFFDRSLTVTLQVSTKTHIPVNTHPEKKKQRIAVTLLLISCFSLRTKQIVSVTSFAPQQFSWWNFGTIVHPCWKMGRRNGDSKYRSASF